MRFEKPARPRSAEPESQSSHERKSRDRFSARPTAGLVLTGRDDELLADLLLLRVMSRSQIQRRYFGSTVRCNARLRQLFDWGFVSRSFPPTAPFVSEGMYSLGKAAAGRIPEIADQLRIDLDADDIRIQSRRPSLSLVEHAMLIGDVHAAVRQGIKASPGMAVELWLPERLVRREYESRRNTGEGASRWRREVFNPDAYFRLRDTDGRMAHLLLEADCGNTNAGQFAGKVRISARFLASDLAVRTIGTNRATTLVVTTAGDRRARNLSRIAESEGAESWRFASLAAVEFEGLMGRVWQCPGSDGLSDLSECFHWDEKENG